MNNFNLSQFILQSIFVFIIVGIIFYFLIKYRAYSLEKRITDFALSTDNIIEYTLVDKITMKFSNLVSRISSLLNKSNVIYKYSGKYDKHISFEERVAKDGTDFVTIKLLLGIIFSIVSLSLNNFNIIFMIVYFIFGFYLIDIPLYLIYKSKEKRVEEDLLNAVIVMNSAFKAGASIIQAIDIVKDDLSGPIADEFKKIANDLKFGLSIEDAFERFYKRINLEEVLYIKSSLMLLNQTGGNIVKVFSSIEKSFHLNKKLKDEYKSNMAASNMIYRILLILPFVLVIGILVLNKSYFDILFSSLIGIIILLVMIFIYSIYVLIVNRIIKVQL